MNIKLIAGAIGFGLLVWLGIYINNQVAEYGENKYNAGYGARVNEEAKAIAELKKEVDTLKLADSEKANEIDKLLREKKKLSDQLSFEINSAELVCPDLGAEFLRLFNEGSGASTSQ